MANHSQWLIRDHFERGEHDAALTLARRAAEVYSNRGLLSLANLHDWRGEHAEAERQYKAAYERYDQPEELLAFYLRNRRKGKDVDELIARVFPAGLQTVHGRFALAPTTGIVVRYPGITGERQGLKAGDIIVAVEGIKVETIPQYRAARGSNRAEAMNFLIWRDGQYIDLQPRLRYHWPINTIDVYRSK
jgi:hypothetical protein